MNEEYFYAEACKNTFLIFDKLNQKELDETFIKWAHQTLLDEKKDDALILIDGKAKNNTFQAKMLILGQDGIFGEFCGNGSRSCAAYLFEKYKEFDNFYLDTNQGLCLLKKYDNGIYSIDLPKAKFTLNNKIIAKPEMFNKENDFYTITIKDKKLYYAEAIEPHLVLKEKISGEELYNLGQYVNSLRDIFPFGININSYKKIADDKLHITTYERGVQRLTMSCGTGSSCVTAVILKNSPGRMNVETPGGILEIVIKKNTFQLKGAAEWSNYKDKY